MRHQSERFLVLYCGGTIGMVASEAGLVPNLDTVRQALAQYGQHLDLDFYAFSPLIDSSAITLADMAALLAKIQQHWHEYVGFLVIHGTDTMAYTASVLAFALAGADKPVVLTGSQKPLLAAVSDGPSNLQQALAALTLPGFQGVGVVFDGQLLHGAAVKKTDAIAFNAFSSPNWPALAQYQAAGWQTGVLPPASGSLNLAVTLQPTAKVATYVLTPGANSDYIGHSLQRDQPQAAVLLTYGNGNGPSTASFIAAMATYVDQGGVLVNVSQVNRGLVAPIYAQGSALSAAGAVAGGGLTLEATWAKLTVGISLGLAGPQLAAWFAADLLGEWAFGQG
ncbi:MAG: asparaginase [Neisseriaceae bacterium]|nr:asparaginase [Neisseriaceae bacterium]MBP6862877.1 asparaginase [Neisseriaceae bacterium]